MLLITEKSYMAAELYKNNMSQPIYSYNSLHKQLPNLFNKKNTNAKCWEKIILP